MSKKEKKPSTPSTLPPLEPKAAPTAKATQETPQVHLDELSKEQLVEQVKAAVAEINKRDRIIQAQSAQLKSLAANVNRLVNANLTLTETLAEARAAAQAAAAQKPAS